MTMRDFFIKYKSNYGEIQDDHIFENVLDLIIGFGISSDNNNNAIGENVILFHQVKEISVYTLTFNIPE